MRRDSGVGHGHCSLHLVRNSGRLCAGLPNTCHLHRLVQLVSYTRAYLYRASSMICFVLHWHHPCDFCSQFSFASDSVLVGKYGSLE